MNTRLSWTLLRGASVAVLLGLLLSAQPARGDGWSLWPIGKSESASHKSKSTASKSPAKSSSKSSSTFLGIPNPFAKKPTKPAANSSHYTTRWAAPKPEEKKNWFTSMFAPKEPDPPKSVRDFMDLEPVRP